MIQNTELKTENFLLRNFTDSDIENVFKGLSHPEVIKYYGVSFSTLEATQEQMEWFRNLQIDETGVWFAICSQDNSKFYGAGGFNSLDKASKKAEIGFWLLPEYWKKGVMSEVFPELCNYAFTILGLHRIEGFVDSENLACKTAMKKLKFVHEGTMRQCEIKNGKFLDLEIYARLKTD